jgi:hypothetical protein
VPEALNLLLALGWVKEAEAESEEEILVIPPAKLITKKEVRQIEEQVRCLKANLCPYGMFVGST